MRSFGRSENQLRPIQIERGYIKNPEGAVLIKMGNTWVLCTVSIDSKTPPFVDSQSSGWIKAEYALLPRSTHVRTPRESPQSTGRTQEIRRLIGRSLRAGIDVTKIPGHMIHIDCDVIQADGGTRTASITGAWIALLDAFRFMFGQQLPDGLLITPLVGAISVGKVGGKYMLDLDYEEDHQAEIDMNVVMTKEGKFAEIQSTAEHDLMSYEDIQAMMELATAGIREVFKAQEEALALPYSVIK